jgi:hypothetical protein
LVENIVLFLIDIKSCPKYSSPASECPSPKITWEGVYLNYTEEMNLITKIYGVKS